MRHAIRKGGVVSPQSEIRRDRRVLGSIRMRQPCLRCSVRPRCETHELWLVAFSGASLGSTCGQWRQRCCRCKSKRARACGTAGKGPRLRATRVRMGVKIPKFSALERIRPRWVYGALFSLTQASVDGHYRFPRPILQPLLFHFALAADLRRRFDFIFWRVETPSLLR